MEAPQLRVNALKSVDARLNRISRLDRSWRVTRRGGGGVAVVRRRRNAQPHKRQRQGTLRFGETALHIGERGLADAPTAHLDHDVAGLDAPGRGARSRDGGDDSGVEQTLRIAQAQPERIGAKVDIEVVIGWQPQYGARRRKEPSDRLQRCEGERVKLSAGFA